MSRIHELLQSGNVKKVFKEAALVASRPGENLDRRYSELYKKTFCDHKTLEIRRKNAFVLMRFTTISRPSWSRRPNLRLNV